ncbi:MAG: SDR family oxidoreductase [Microvirga sp.]
MPSALFDLSGRTALITGSTRGIGFALSQGLGEAGATVILNSRQQAAVDEAVATLKSRGLDVHGAAFDVADPGSVSAAFDAFDRQGLQIDILVNNAGIQHRAPIQDFPAEAWDRMIATHLSAPFFLAQAVAPGMIARRRGKIINTLSVTSELGRPTIIPYASAKGGLRMLTRGLAVELGPHNIQVNGIGPGYFTTEMNRALIDNPEFDAWVKKRTPAGRWGDPSELAGAAVFLASPAADYVTGQVIFVDGGFTASM